MSLYGNMKTDVEIKAPADKFYEFYSCTPYLMSKYCPKLVQSVDLHGGQWGKEGSIVSWNFFLDEKAAKNKVRVEDIDNENKSITYKTIEGNLLEVYMSFKIILQVAPREEGSLVHWTVEYEKPKEDVPDPKTMLQIVADCCKDVDAHLIQKSPQVLNN